MAGGGREDGGHQPQHHVPALAGAGGPVDEEAGVRLPERDEQGQHRQAHLVAALRHELERP